MNSIFSITSANVCYTVICLILFAVLAGLASSSFISDDVFEAHGSTGRSILQAKTACTVDFEHKNYTVITSQCKGPNYQPTPCCSALKQFACPVVDEINDANSDCATTMFSYINLYGKYPPALFASLCREGKEGLACKSTDISSGKNSEQKSGAVSNAVRYPIVVMLAGFFMMVLGLF